MHFHTFHTGHKYSCLKKRVAEKTLSVTFLRLKVQGVAKKKPEGFQYNGT